MRFFIYSRKSVYTGRGESVENQVELCRQYLESRFPSERRELVIYEDEGFSAKNTDRPQFQRMLRALRREKPDYLVCYRLDRVSRNVSDFAGLIEELLRLGVSFLCIREEFDTSKPMGKAMMYIASVFAQLERETIAERVRDNMRLLARDGRWLGGTPPTGFRAEREQYIGPDGRPRTACALQVIEREAETVCRIYRLFLSGMGLVTVAAALGGRYTPQGVREILRNPVYCAADSAARAYFLQRGADVCFSEEECGPERGILPYNRRGGRGGGPARQPVEAWIIARGAHRALISGERWVAAQRRLSDTLPDSARPAKQHNGYALLSGLLRCGRCGEKLFAKPRGREGKFDYICAGKLAGGCARCAAQNLGGEQTDAAVWARVRRLLQPDRAQLLREVDALERAVPCGEKRRVQRLCSERENLLAALASCGKNPRAAEQIAMRLEELLQELREARREELRTASPDAAALLAPCGENLLERRELLRKLVREVRWDGEELTLFLRCRA